MPERPGVEAPPFGEALPTPATPRLPKVVFAVAAALLAAVLVVVVVLTERAKRDDRGATAEQALLRVGVISAQQRGPGVELIIVNQSPLPFRVLRQQLDGASPVEGPSQAAAPQGRLALVLRWRPPCANGVQGPSLLRLTLRAPRGDHELRLALDAATQDVFRRAAACP